jgi:hypothetical protein
MVSLLRKPDSSEFGSPNSSGYSTEFSQTLLRESEDCFDGQSKSLRDIAHKRLPALSADYSSVLTFLGAVVRE